jgi:hypothetical protein
MSKNDTNHDESPESSDQASSVGENPDHTGEKDWRTVSFRSRDKVELERIVSTWPTYKSPSHVLQAYLSESLLSRIEAGDYSPRKLAREVTGQAPGHARHQIMIGLKNWERVEQTARAANADLRRLEENIAWNGTVRSAPFCRFEATMIVRAAAREIAAWSQGEAEHLLSPELTLNRPAESLGNRQVGGRKGGEKQRDEEPTGPDPKYRVLETPAGYRRGGKQVCIAVTKEAANKLKTMKQSWAGSDLIRRSLQLILRWIEESPEEAFTYIKEDQPFYQRPREGEYRGYQVRIEAETKRRLKQARLVLQNGPGERLDRRIEQREILQATARWTLESRGPDLPLPGNGPSSRDS